MMRNSIFLTLLVVAFSITSFVFADTFGSMTLITGTLNANNLAVENRQVYKLELRVTKGWNLIPALRTEALRKKETGKQLYRDESGNLIVESQQILPESEIKGANIKALFYYSPSQRKYFDLNADANGAFESAAKDLVALGVNPDDEQNKWYNYLQTSAVWFYSDTSGVLVYEMMGFPMKELMNKRKLLAGWNLIVITPEMEGKSNQDVLGDCVVEKAYFFDNDLKKWMGGNKSDNRLWKSPSVGYAIKVSKNCQLGSSKEEIAPLPPLPE